jgi:UTP--glucose-1-phosphate uridylyltransferase
MNPSMIVRKAVFPVGGFGTGILPATKAAPKELLPVVDKPLIQYAVEEALRADIRQMIFITNRNKRVIENHFDKAYELEAALALQNRCELLAELRRLFPPDVSYVFVRQPEPLGLGHALGCARSLIGDEPFLVIASDDLIDAPIPAARQLVSTFRRWGQPVIGTLAAGSDCPGAAGFVDGVAVAPGVTRITRVRAPRATSAASAPMAGRFLLLPQVFDYLATTPPQANGEVELADALQAMLGGCSVLARELDGERFDCGTKLGHLAATLHFGLRHPSVGAPFAALVQAAAAAPVAPQEFATSIRALREVRPMRDSLN